MCILVQDNNEKAARVNGQYLICTFAYWQSADQPFVRAAFCMQICFRYTVA